MAAADDVFLAVGICFVFALLAADDGSRGEMNDELNLSRNLLNNFCIIIHLRDVKDCLEDDDYLRNINCLKNVDCLNCDNCLRSENNLNCDCSMNLNEIAEMV